MDIEKIKTELKEARDILTTAEVNMNNYNYDDVLALNSSVNLALLNLTGLLNIIEGKKRARKKDKRTTTTLFGLEVEGRVVRDDWEGDPDVPNGVHYLPTYVEDMTVTAPDGTDITEYLSDGAIDKATEALLEEEWSED